MFGKKFLSLRTKSILKKNKIIRASTSFNNAKNIGIIFSSDDKFKFDCIKQFKKDLENEGKTVVVLSYLGKGKENHEFLFDFFTSKDISFWGRFTSSLVNDFIAQPFDFVFSVDTKSNIYTDNILACSQAKCRVGIFSENKSRFFELMININDSKPINALIHDMYHFTKKLN